MANERLQKLVYFKRTKIIQVIEIFAKHPKRMQKYFFVKNHIQNDADLIEFAERERVAENIYKIWKTCHILNPEWKKIHNLLSRKSKKKHQALRVGNSHAKYT